MSPRIGLLWHSLRSANLGWGALTLSHLAMLKQASDVSKRKISVRVIHLLDGPLRYSDSAELSPEEVVIGQEALERDPGVLTASTRSAIADCDVFMDIAGGDLFSDIYGDPLFSWLIDSRLAVLDAGKRLILSPQTVGPFKSSPALSRAAEVARRCEKIFTRDSQSMMQLREMNSSENAEATIDMAFRLPFTPPRREHDGTVRMGLDVSGLVDLSEILCLRHIMTHRSRYAEKEEDERPIRDAACR